MNKLSLFRLTLASFCLVLTWGILLENSQRLKAQNIPYCFMLNQEGQLINLSSICGKVSSNTTEPRRNNSHNNGSFPARSQETPSNQNNSLWTNPKINKMYLQSSAYEFITPPENLPSNFPSLWEVRTINKNSAQVEKRLLWLRSLD